VSTSSLPVGAVLDDASETVRQVAAPWVGVLLLTALPLRLLQARFVDLLLTLGPESGQHGDALAGEAQLVLLSLLPALLGRAVYVRACGLALRRGQTPGREALALRWPGVLSYLYVALLLETLFFALGVSLVAIPILVVLAGLAAAAHPLCERAGLLAPLRLLARQLVAARVLAALAFVFGAALLIACFNLYIVFQVGLWLADALPGVDAAAAAAALSAQNPRFLLVLGVGAVLVVEPFWLAALTVYVHRLGSRRSGEDLRLWFEQLRARVPA
jgi:hypothetical protein